MIGRESLWILKFNLVAVVTLPIAYPTGQMDAMVYLATESSNKCARLLESYVLRPDFFLFRKLLRHEMHSTYTKRAFMIPMYVSGGKRTTKKNKVSAL